MSAPVERVKCWGCGVVFRVAAPVRGVETTVCAEPKCRRRFWSTGADGRHSLRTRAGQAACNVGVWPQDAHRFVEVTP